MANTTYDEIWKQFLLINQTENINLPNSDEKIYDVIESAIKHYNTKMKTTITCDNLTEIISVSLEDWKLILLAHFIRLSFCENQLIDFSTTWQPLQKDIGIKNYQEQSRNLKDILSREDDKIDEIYISNYSDYDEEV